MGNSIYRVIQFEKTQLCSISERLIDFITLVCHYSDLLGQRAHYLH